MVRNGNGQKSKEMVIAKIPPIVLTETHNPTFFSDLQISFQTLACYVVTLILTRDI